MLVSGAFITIAVVWTLLSIPVEGPWNTSKEAIPESFLKGMLPEQLGNRLSVTPLWLIIITTIAVTFGLLLGPRLKIAAFVAITLLLFYVMYAYRTGVIADGLTLVFLYLLAIAVAGLAIKALTGAPKRESFTAGILIAAIFTILGISHIWKYEQLPWRSGSQQTAFAPERPTRTGTWEVVTVGPNPVQINPGASYKSRIRHPAGCIYMRRAVWTGDNRRYGPICDAGTQALQIAPNDVEWIWSSDGRTFQASVRLGN